ncbi:hypothetical protein PoB_003851100 [Plakobranchus ocellatus]|uniref:Uncharacterized protein n=1 Tax=Plakobranchus ocellatus TaxID=259542 RepID=A0AAV4AV45_9GAST|nr:hypothetical protein PoB_003851100 [Plakobranchus ocellatus]
MFPKMIRMNESNQLEWDVDRDMLQPVHNEVTSDFQAPLQALAPLVGFEPTTEGSVPSSGRMYCMRIESVDCTRS